MENRMNPIIEISDFFAPELDIYARLTEAQLLNKEFPEKGMFIAESPKVIGRALDAGYEPISCLMEKRHIDGEGKEILDRINDVPIFCAEADVLTQLTGFKLTRGMLCAMRRKPLPSVKELCENKSRIVILDVVTKIKEQHAEHTAADKAPQIFEPNAKQFRVHHQHNGQHQ